MSAELFQILVVGGIYAEVTSLLWVNASMGDITKLLAAILNEIEMKEEDDEPV